MEFRLMHPRDQIVMLMERIYGYGMTTTSGGNLSIMDDSGDLWITPAGVDKGQLKPRDIVCVKADGSIEGIHKPSSEYPFHQAILKKRPDLHAVLHAHPSALVSFSILRKIPDTRIVPKAQDICGEVGYAEYALPGSRELGDKIAEKFAAGHHTVLLENHGVVTGGETLFKAFQRFETLDYCARLILRANILGKERPISQAQFDLFQRQKSDLPVFKPRRHSSREKELRKLMCEIIHRSYDHSLVTSLEGTFSTRVDEKTILITPYGIDRKYLDIEHMVLVQDGKTEEGKTPSRSLKLHLEIYRKQPDIHAIIIAHPTNVMAFGVSDTRLDTRTIPESYIVLRDIPMLPYGAQFMEMENLTSMVSADVPIVLVENDCLVVTGENLLHAYDRLEVAEFSAKAVIEAKSVGEIIPINDDQVEALKKAFLS